MLERLFRVAYGIEKNPSRVVVGRGIVGVQSQCGAGSNESLRQGAEQPQSISELRASLGRFRIQRGGFPEIRDSLFQLTQAQACDSSVQERTGVSGIRIQARSGIALGAFELNLGISESFDVA